MFELRGFLMCFGKSRIEFGLFTFVMILPALQSCQKNQLTHGEI